LDEIWLNLEFNPSTRLALGIINSSARMLTLKFLLDTQHLESNDSRIWIEAGLVT